MEAQLIEKFLTPEHQVRTYREKYHEGEITIIELDQQKSRLKTGEPILEFPKDYVKQITNVVGNDGYFFAPEYCVPDLIRSARFVAGEYTSNPLISFISRLAGATGRKQIAADPANNIAFGIIELTVSNTKFIFQEAFRNFPNERFGPDIPLTGLYEQIENREIDRSNTNDARHLLPARAFMQDLLRKI